MMKLFKRIKKKDEPAEESYNTEQLLRKWQMKFNADNCRVNHRQKIHLVSHSKMKGSELITAIQEQALRIITNSCRKTSAPSSEIKANSRSYLEWNKTENIIRSLYKEMAQCASGVVKGSSPPHLKRMQ